MGHCSSRNHCLSSRKKFNIRFQWLLKCRKDENWTKWYHWTVGFKITQCQLPPSLTSLPPSTEEVTLVHNDVDYFFTLASYFNISVCCLTVRWHRIFVRFTSHSLECVALSLMTDFICMWNFHCSLAVSWKELWLGSPGPGAGLVHLICKTFVLFDKISSVFLASLISLI